MLFLFDSGIYYQLQRGAERAAELRRDDDGWSQRGDDGWERVEVPDDRAAQIDQARSNVSDRRETSGQERARDFQSVDRQAAQQRAQQAQTACPALTARARKAKRKVFNDREIITPPLSRPAIVSVCRG